MIAAALLVLLLQAAENAAPTDARSPEEFAAAARRASERYHDPELAIADGYRLIGEDFPGMGEHWLHSGLLFDGVLDPERPEFLSYVVVDGRRRLLGTAYALPLLSGETPPEWPAGTAAWHSHDGTLDAETLTPHHAGHHHAADGPRLAMLHAWVWLDNPEGTYAADNWGVPYFRLGLQPPGDGAIAPGKALALLSGTDGYLLRMVERAGASGRRLHRAAAAIAHARSTVAQTVAAHRGPTLTSAELDHLRATWDALWRAIDEAVDPGTRERLDALGFR